MRLEDLAAQIIASDQAKLEEVVKVIVVRIVDVRAIGLTRPRGARPEATGRLISRPTARHSTVRRNTSAQHNLVFFIPPMAIA